MGWWKPQEDPTPASPHAMHGALQAVGHSLSLVERDGELCVGLDGTASIGSDARPLPEYLPLRAHVSPLRPENLGCPAFRATYGLRYAYLVGAMANAITSVEMVSVAARGGLLAFFGAAGLPLGEIENAIRHLQGSLGNLPFGANLIHSPGDPDLERATAELYLQREVRLVCASAFLRVTPALVLYRAKGIHRDPHGAIHCPNRIFAKVSRVEVARKFLEPPPGKILADLVASGLVTAEEAELAGQIPLAQELTAEADSGGHTDNRPAISLLPTIVAVRDEVDRRHAYRCPPRIGLAGGIATPASVAAAFAMGAAFVMAGSIHQGCVEAGTAPVVLQMLAEAGQADTAMAPSADMFEMGVKVQVLKRGTLFPQRAAKLYELYRAYERYEQIPAAQRSILERDFFRRSFDEEWQSTRTFFLVRDPRQVELGDQNPRHRMALVFRSYLGQASSWAKHGVTDRQIDYQIWCGPAMGAFNEWARGSFLEKAENRDTMTLAGNLLFGACVLARCTALTQQGIQLKEGSGNISPMSLLELDKRLGQ